MARARRARAAETRRQAQIPSAERVWPLRVVAALLFLLGVIPLANFLTDGPGLPWWRASVQAWLVSGAIVLALAFAVGGLFADRVEALLDLCRRALLRPSARTFSLVVGSVSALLALWFGWYLNRWQPVAGDEFSQLWQARLLTLGRVFARGEAHPEFFSTSETLTRDGRWFSQFPVGGPAFASLGLLVRAPWLVNPLLTGIAGVALYRFVVTTRDELTARVTGLLFVLCPFVLFMGGSQMNHTPTLACVMVALAALAAWRSAENEAAANRAAMTVGGALGIAATIRPYDAALIGLVIGIFQLRAAFAHPLLRSSLVRQCLVGAIPVALLLAANWATVGAPFAFAYDALHGPEHRPGFHHTPLGFEHTPRRGLYMVSAYLMKLDVGLLGWPVPAVLLVVAALVFARKADQWDGVLLATMMLMLAGYMIYWSESYFLGPRFLFSVAPVFLIYIARLPLQLRARTRAPLVRAAAALLIPFWLVIGWTAPADFAHVQGVWRLAKGYQARTSISARLVGRVAESHLSNALVFVPDGWRARLTARLRAVGVRPLIAEEVVKQVDGCAIQESLDAVERTAVPSEQRASAVMALIAREAPAFRVAGLRDGEQISLVAGRALPAHCQREMASVSGSGITLAELLRYQSLNSRGELGGNVVYARHLGERNEMLRARFGDRRWYVARVREIGDSTDFTLEPYVNGAR